MATTLDRHGSAADEKAPVSERITVALTFAAAKQLRRLQEWSGLSKTDVVNRAISLYHFVAEHERDGRKLALYDPEKDEFQIVHVL